ncbi:hypothetical protein CF70_029425 [Cupriavidus sp. SK-3]|uniref:DUF2933 domain-containing protein n=1 Tax=Cupriavidus sp. SK-3 TaxID=1470558 RepID=UPI00044DFE29|nr:DUF2933 domain-containing protein [Cupriavidus sp. SK-3]KDP88625.1 hypothetical protein CF70_029425 [Cupriavidus sp. SK-3]
MCSIKSIVQFALGLGFGLLVVYVAFPQYQAAITGFAPYLLILACPLAMMTMGGSKPQEKTKPTDTSKK